MGVMILGLQKNFIALDYHSPSAVTRTFLRPESSQPSLKWHSGGNVSRQLNMLDDKKIAPVCNHVRCMNYSDVIPNNYMIMTFIARREISKGVKCNKFCLRFPQSPNFCVAAVFAKIFRFDIYNFDFVDRSSLDPPGRETFGSFTLAEANMSLEYRNDKGHDEVWKFIYSKGQRLIKTT